MLDKEKGYIFVKRIWKAEDYLEWDMEMRPQFVQADRRVYYNAGKAAVVRGPLVYCIEEMDNGSYLYECRVDTECTPREEWEEELSGYYSLSLSAVRYQGRIQDKLYDRTLVHKKPVCLKAVPYFLWNNRGEGEMVTWIPIL